MFGTKGSGTKGSEIKGGEIKGRPNFIIKRKVFF